jgi:hypothetical protein
MAARDEVSGVRDAAAQSRQAGVGHYLSAQASTG